MRIGDRDDGVLVKRGLKICRLSHPDLQRLAGLIRIDARLFFASFMDAAPGRLALSDRDLEEHGYEQNTK